jgi:hypothetical protein
VPDEPRDQAAETVLRNLEQRLTQASAAAERLIVEAADAVAGRGRPAREGEPSTPADRGGEREPSSPGDRGGEGDPSSPGDRSGEGEREAPGSQPPPWGFQRAGADRDRLSEDLELLAGVARRFRDLVPPELERRLAEALRELLLAVRALVDWCLDRLEHRRRTPPEVRDIPIL